jgi:SanA protein
MYRIIRKTILFAGLSVLLFSIFINIPIFLTSLGKIQNDPARLPEIKYGVVLGTSKYVQKGILNSFYKDRIDAAENL